MKVSDLEHAPLEPYNLASISKLTRIYITVDFILRADNM